MSCPRADDVVAVFLDGDARQDADQDLAQHLSGCAACRHTLAQARRLDAALAQGSGLTVEPDLARRLVQRAMATAEPAPRQRTAPGLRLRPLPLVLAAAALVWMGIGVGHLLVPVSPTSPVPAQPQPPTIASTPPGFVPLPEVSEAVAHRRRGTPRILGQRPRARTPEHLVLGSILRDQGQGLTPVVLPVVALTRLLHWRGLGQDIRRVQDQVREQAGRRLLRCHRTAARKELLAYLAQGAGDGVMERLLAHAAGDGRFLGFVRGELRRDPDGRALAAAARLADPGLDRLLRELCRGRAGRSHRLASALARREQRPGRVPLLLDLWQSLEDRGMARDADRLAERWFAGLPAATTPQLAALARTTSRASRRHQCILALGARRDPQALPYLLELVTGPRHGDAVTAAHALGKLPPAEVDAKVLAMHPHSRRPQLLLAALASMRSPRVHARILAMELTDTERQFLVAGRFNHEQFTLAARLFRERRRLTD